jgi:hydrogenase nickel incorporation protein HypB
MCENCGCSDTANHVHEQGHQHDPAVAAVLSRNDRLAERNRGFFLAKRVSVVNLLSCSRSNVLALVERTLAGYGGKRRVKAVTVADLEKLGALHQHPHGHPHDALPEESVAVDAHAVGHALSHLDLDEADLVFIVNGGSAACQAVYDLGETARVAVFSVREGELKPLKFPLLFSNARAVVINEIDQAGAAGFDMAAARSNLKQVAPGAAVLALSPDTGAGMESWYDFLDELVALNGK